MSKNDGGLPPLFGSALRRLGFMVQRVETGGTGRGIPDTFWARAGACGWVEFKAESSLGAVGLRPEQVAWIDRCRREGCRAHVAVRLRHGGGPRKGPPADELWLMDGAWAREIKRGGLLAGAPWVLGRWAGGPTSWRWDVAAELLVG